jgi:hypothetical protein
MANLESVSGAKDELSVDDVTIQRHQVDRPHQVIPAARRLPLLVFRSLSSLCVTGRADAYIRNFMEVDVFMTILNMRLMLLSACSAHSRPFRI